MATTGPRLNAKRVASVATATIVIALAALTVSWSYVVRDPPRPMVDLGVYHRAADAVLAGRPVYERAADLVFTYPPFAALLVVPLAALPDRAAAAIWTAATVAALTGVVWLSFRPVLRRLAPAGRPFAVAGITVTALVAHPVIEHLIFGQVNIFLVLLCLTDFFVVPRRWRGVLVGVASAIKLTPGLFVIYLLVTRRWHEARNAALAFGACTLLGLVVLPSASSSFWTTEVFEADRVAGAVSYTSNQSLLGMVSRALPAPWATPAWLVGAIAVALFGFTRARRAWRAGDDRGGVAIMSLLVMLLSPVAWIHHGVWFVPALGAFTCLAVAPDRPDGEHPARWTGPAVAAASAGLLALRLPWWGWRALDQEGIARVGAVLMHNAYGLLALVLLAAYPVSVGRWQHPEDQDRSARTRPTSPPTPTARSTTSSGAVSSGHFPPGSTSSAAVPATGATA